MTTVEQVNSLANQLDTRERSALLAYWGEIVKGQKPKPRVLFDAAGFDYPAQISKLFAKLKRLRIVEPMKAGRYLRPADYSLTLAGVALADFLMKLEGGTNEIT